MSYSIIIPTMWVNKESLVDMCRVYEGCDLVDEVLVINNNDRASIPLLFSKVRIIGNGTNKYVNPSWNYGVRMAKCDRVVIANDDIDVRAFDPMMRVLDAYLEPGWVIGVHNSCFPIKNKFNPYGFRPGAIDVIKSASMNWGWGVFMVLHKKDYVHIPEEYLIWYGDDYQYKNLYPHSIIGPLFETKMSETLDSSRHLSSLAAKDAKRYAKNKKNGR